MKMENKLLRKYLFRLLVMATLVLTGNETMRAVALPAPQNTTALFTGDKGVIKKIKKDYNVKEVTPMAGTDGFCYYLIRTYKDFGDYGIADAEGKLVLPARYKEINYAPAVSDGFSEARPGKVKIYHKAQPAHFLVSLTKPISPDFQVTYHDGVMCNFFMQQLLDVNGNVILDNIDYRLEPISGYYIIGAPSPLVLSSSVEAKHFDNGKVGLMTATGEMLILPQFDKLEIAGDVVNYFVTIDGIERMGGALLSNIDNNIPPLFHSVRYNEGKWMVKRNKNSEEEIFNPVESKANITYRDEGERFFDQGKYNDVVKFYAENGVNAPWAKYFTGKAIYELASEETSGKMGNFAASVEIRENIDKNHPVEVPYIDWDWACGALRYAEEMLLLYLVEDSTYKQQAYDALRNIRWEIEEIEKGRRMEFFNETKQRYDKVIAAEQRKAQSAENAMAFANAMNNFFTMLSNSLEQTSRATGASTSVSRRNTATAQNGNTQGNAEPKAKRDNSAKIQQLERELGELENTIKEQEDYIENKRASGDTGGWTQEKALLKSRKKRADSIRQQIDSLK